MNVLSLFDGLSGGQLALSRLGIKVDNYYASEVDKHAIQGEFMTKESIFDSKNFGDEVELLANEPKEIWLKNLYDSFRSVNSTSDKSNPPLVLIKNETRIYD